MGGSQVLRDNAKRYWDDDGYDTDDTRMIDPAVEEGLDTLNAGEEWEQDVPVEFIMQKPAAKPQYWI